MSLPQHCPRIFFSDGKNKNIFQKIKKQKIRLYIITETNERRKDMSATVVLTIAVAVGNAALTILRNVKQG